MKRPFFGLATVAYFAVLAWLVASWTSPGCAKDEPNKPTELKLGSIYSTNRQPGLNAVDQGIGDKGFANELTKLYQKSIEMGASNVFLAKGDDIGAAVRATLAVFRAGEPVDMAADDVVGSNSERYWLVAYFGTSGSAPPVWSVKSASRSGDRIRLAFTARKAGPRTDDSHPYFVWVPLGKLEPGFYTLELFDDGKPDLTLMRKVSIPKP